ADDARPPPLAQISGEDQHRHGRIPGHAMAPGLYVQETHLRLRQRARDLPWGRRTQSVRNAAALQFLAQSAIRVPETAARHRNRAIDERQDFRGAETDER